MICINTYSLVGEYVLYMHHIFSQQGIRNGFIEFIIIRVYTCDNTLVSSYYSQQHTEHCAHWAAGSVTEGSSEKRCREHEKISFFKVLEPFFFSISRHASYCVCCVKARDKLSLSRLTVLGRRRGHSEKCSLHSTD